MRQDLKSNLPNAEKLYSKKKEMTLKNLAHLLESKRTPAARSSATQVLLTAAKLVCLVFFGMIYAKEGQTLDIVAIVSLCVLILLDKYTDTSLLNLFRETIFLQDKVLAEQKMLIDEYLRQVALREGFNSESV